MSAISYECPECHQVVDVDERRVGADAECPHCGIVFRVATPDAKAIHDNPPAGRPIAQALESSADNEHVVERVHPALFRQYPLNVGGLFLVMAAGVFCVVYPLLYDIEQLAGNENWLMYGGVAVTLISAGILGIWWIAMLFTTLTVTSKRTILRRGIIARNTTEVLHEDVRNLQVSQTVVQRILGVGRLAVSSSGQDILEVDINGIPRPERLAAEIRKRQ